jgi:hypothetical protein
MREAPGAVPLPGRPVRNCDGFAGGSSIYVSPPRTLNALVGVWFSCLTHSPTLNAFRGRGLRSPETRLATLHEWLGRIIEVFLFGSERDDER